MKVAPHTHSVLAVLDKLAQVAQASLLCLVILLHDRDDCVHDGFLVIESAFFPQH